MDIVVVNCNTSPTMTEAIGVAARGVARPGTVIHAVNAAWGVESAEGFYDSYVSAAAVLDLLSGWRGPMDGVVLAGFGEHGREGARQLLEVPVVDITEAAAMFACLLGYTYGVVTTTHAATQQIRQSLLVAGLLDRCAGVRATGLRVLDLELDGHRTTEQFVAEGTRLLAEGAEVIILGCAGMAGLHRRVREHLAVPVIEGVTAGVSLCEDLVHHGFRTSKVRTFADVGEGKTRSARPSVFSSRAPLPE